MDKRQRRFLKRHDLKFKPKTEMERARAMMILRGYLNDERDRYGETTLARMLLEALDVLKHQPLYVKPKRNPIKRYHPVRGGSTGLVQQRRKRRY